MSGPFPCNNPPNPCETSPNPLTNFSSEAEDSTTFIGIAWAAQLPALNKPFNVYPCEAITDSQVSQSDADIRATNLAVACANPCAPLFFNTAQTATGTCSNGSTYSLTIPAGIFTADNQVLADRKAFTAATTALRGHSICLGSLAPASVCIGDFYFGIITVVNTDTPANIILISGETPEGLSITFETDRAVVQGTPISFGTSRFTLRATSAVGVVTQQEYVVSVIGIVTSSPLTDAIATTPYSAQLVAIIPDGSLATWTVTAGALPDGLTLNSVTGEISGTPTTVGSSAFTVSVTDGVSTCSKDFSVAVVSGSNICTDGIDALATNRYGIQGYFDGMITNPNPSVSLNPAWDGTFIFYTTVPDSGFNGWFSGGEFVNPISMEGHSLCSVAIIFAGCIADVPQWQLWIGDLMSNDPTVQAWYGEKAGGATPEGTYNLTNGIDPAPLTLTIELVDTTATPTVDSPFCFS